MFGEGGDIHCSQLLDQSSPVPTEDFRLANYSYSVLFFQGKEGCCPTSKIKVSCVRLNFSAVSD